MFEQDTQISGSLIYTKKKYAPGDTYMPADPAGANPEQARRRKANFLDSQRGHDIHGNLLGHYLRELDRQAENRMEMAVDEDFYDHIQFSEDDLAVLKARGQAPLVFNAIHTTVNWVLGTQRRAPTDYRILARKKEGIKAAERKTELLKHVTDANIFTHEESLAFASAVKAGVGWLEAAQADSDHPAKVMLRSENWRSMLWDSTAVQYDLEDARYIFRSKWMDVDQVASLWTHRLGVIERSITQSTGGLYMLDDLGDEAMDHQEAEHFYAYASGHRNLAGTSHRDRIRVVEAWFKRVVPDAAVIRGGQFNGELFDQFSPGHVSEINNGVAFLSTRPRQVVHCAIFTEAGLLDLRRTPYRHGRYPFTPIWGYRRARDLMPYGIIRGIRDIQRDMNRRAAKALHHLSTTRVLVQKGAVEDIETLRDEAARPDAVIEYLEGQPAPQINTDTNIAAAHVDMMSRDADMIQQVAGVTDENMGRRTNATSGIAIERRQNQGQLSTSMFFDNLTLARRLHGAKVLVNIETFYTQQDQFRITDSRGNPDWRTINDGAIENAIAEFAADFVITDEDWRATVRQAQAAQLLELAKELAATAPQIVMQILDLVVEALDVPKRDELVKRIRQITGVDDPDADPNNPTPEQIAAQEAKAKQAEMMDRQAKAALQEMEAKARKLGAEATKAEASAASDMIGQMKAAMEAALQIAGAPAVAAAADQILTEARAEAGLNPQFGQTPEPPPMPQPQPMPEDMAEPPMPEALPQEGMI
jgi:hypothetical protein